MAKAAYTDQDMARLYVVLTTNEGNVKRTARDTAIPESTVRRYKKLWEDEGPPKIEQEIAEAVTEYASEMEKTADLALKRMHERLERDEGTLPQIATVFGVLRDKIDRTRGIADKRVEHVHSLPSPDEIRKTLGALVMGAQAGHLAREEEIIEAEFSEQPPALLPSGTR